MIVQQNWIRQEFEKKFNLNNVIVAHPVVKSNKALFSGNIKAPEGGIYQFFYPSYARCFKNFEVICEAVKLLNAKNVKNFKVVLTIDGTENRYASSIVRKYKELMSIEFIGRQTRDCVFRLYNSTDCLIFPSKLETWGLPITEFKQFNKPMILSDLPYAHETIGNYDKVKFFNPESAKELGMIMEGLVTGACKLDEVKQKKIKLPFAANWGELFEIILDKKKEISVK